MQAGAGPSRIARAGELGFESTVQTWLEEDASDIETDCDEDFCVTNSDNSSEGEISDSDLSYNEEDEEQDENEVTENISSCKAYYGRNRYKWSSEPFVKRSRTQKHNIVIHLPGLKGQACVRNRADPDQIWNLLVTDEMLQNIMVWTNVKLKTERQKFKNPNCTDMRDVDMIELRAFIGLLFYTAVFKSNRESTMALFATDGSGRDIFRCVMSEHRFNLLLSMIRFDNPATREDRRRNDPAAAISELFEMFVKNCRAVYTVGTASCVDEMLVSFRGRCKFKVYMPNKPAKYGIKLMCLTDARNGYFYDGYIYVGKNSDGDTLSADERKFSKPTQAVLRLTKHIQGTHRNVTGDNWFTSIEMVQCLSQRGLTYVGTVRRNKRGIPKEFLPSKSREPGSSLFGFTNDMTLVSYVPKKNKVVLLLSSMHHEKSFDKETGKTEINEYYNLTKGGVDSLDEKCANYCTGRRTRRYSAAIFYRILDVSSVNAFIMYSSYKDNQEVSRLNFLKDLACRLVKPQLERRATNMQINREVRACIRRVLGVKEEIPYTEEERLEKRKTCTLCDPRKKRKTNYLCYLCKKPVCLECTKKVCNACAHENL